MVSQISNPNGIHVGEGIRLSSSKYMLDLEITRKDRTKIIFNIDSIEAVFKKTNSNDNCFVIDENVFSIHRDRIDRWLHGRVVIRFPSGEKNKTLDNVAHLVSSLYERGVNRKSTLIGVGGGVITDVTGLLANLYFRGINVAYVPTSLLAMIDAAIGGKVGVNHPLSKKSHWVFLSS